MSLAEQHDYLRRRLSRRSALRTGAAGAGTVLGAGLLGGSARATEPLGTPMLYAPSTGAVPGRRVAPFGRHLTFGSDPRTQMRISWQVPLPVRGPFVRVGLRPWELSRRIEAEVRHLHTPALSDSLPAVDQYYLHAALDGLHPGTTYYYGVGHEGWDPAEPNHYGSLGTFRTAPRAAEAFTFTAFGDQGISYDALANDQLILGQDPAFHLHAGDICYADSYGQGSTADRYDARLWDQFLNQNDAVASRVPWMVTTGNHDMEAWYSPDGYGGQLARWSLPPTGPDPRKAPGVYSFVYGNLGVVALDANDVSHEIPANRGYTEGRQTRWLDRELGRLRRTPGIDFIVVFHHHCAFSTTNAHASDGGVRDAWVRLFDKHQVDLAINGHNHVYERTDAIRGGRPGRKVPIGEHTDPVRDGLVYVTAGGGGAMLFSFPAPDSYEGHEKDVERVETYHWTGYHQKELDTVEWSRVRYTGHSFLSVRVRPGSRPEMRVSALAESGERIDHFTVRRSR
ncbi:metallophosphoesterase family protein [Streptomyces palmae]|uniref:Metallophosphoesterase family protein n=2 Tax=Streptomyces palmae TaxID=1701085 RepID=A0A4Z0HB97_9ACTN|nr:metallophosphoesterase family protein [Streptomyces palmae]TGB07144.1 metallophosphoesterase family protein [Streptomyces palmae]